VLLFFNNNELNTTSKTIGILGFGWLGSALAEALLQKKYTVHASKTNWEDTSEASPSGLKKFQLVVGDKKMKGDLSFFENTSQLLILLPPSQRKTGFDLLAVLKTLYAYLPNTAVERILFTSSTSIYGAQAGTLDERTPAYPNTQNGTTLTQCETFIQEQDLPYVVLRLGGLIGPNRHPIKQLQHKSISNPEGFINFIHQTDAVNILIKILENESLEGIFNGVCPSHPKRRDYYEAMAKKRGLPPLRFTNEPPLERIIDSKKITDAIGYTFEVNNLLI